MNLRQFFITFLIISSAISIHAQTVTISQILKLEKHPTDSAKFIAKMYNNKTGRLEEYWEMITHVPEISVADFNKQVNSDEIQPHGKCFFLYPNRVKELELNYEYGNKIGEIKGYYNTGELRFQGTYRYNPIGKFISYFKDGSISKEEEYTNGFENRKTICYYPSGNIYMENNFVFDQEDGKQTIYYPNGELKRIRKYKMGKLLSEKCFDSTGTKNECSELINEPYFGKGKDQFLRDLLQFSFDEQKSLKDTLLFSISLNIDTGGVINILSYFLSGQDSLPSEFKNWIQNHGSFSPMRFDDQPRECTLNILLPMVGNKFALSDFIEKWHFTNRNNLTQEDEEIFYWNFLSKNYNSGYYVGKDTSTTYFIVEKIPEFPGGEQALRVFIANNIKYPVLAMEQGIQGKVYVTFVIDQNGYPCDARVAAGVHPVLDAEALRVVSTLPRWTPGMQRGIPVRVSYTVPIGFYLEGIKENSKIGNIIIE